MPRIGPNAHATRDIGRSWQSRDADCIYGVGMAMHPASTPLEFLQQAGPSPRRRRWGLVVIGIILAFFGLGLLVVGAILGAVEQTRSSFDPVAEARTPGTLIFDADDDLYRVAIQGERRRVDASIAANVRCTVELANEATIELNGGRQSISETTGNIASVGTFDAVAGRTRITCRAPQDGVRFFVDDESSLQSLGNVGVISGSITAAIGAVLILLGVFTRKRGPATS